MNTHAQELNRVFSERIKSWENIPVGDPFRILVDGVAEHLAQTEKRYRAMLDKVFFCAPEIVGIELRPAQPAVVELMLQSKNESSSTLGNGHEFYFKYLNRDFRVRILNEIEVRAGEKTSVRAEFSEIKQSSSFGIIFGEYWEEVEAHNLLPGFQEILLRFPDESTRILKSYPASDLIRVKDTEELEDKFIYVRGTVIIPYAPGICAGYPSGVTLEVPRAYMLCDPETFKLELMKAVEVRGQAVSVSVSRVLRRPARAETQSEYAERVRNIIHRAQAGFNAEKALSGEEISAQLVSQFPDMEFSLSLDTEAETLFLDLKQPLDEISTKKLRRVLESKVCLRFEVVIREASHV